MYLIEKGTPEKLVGYIVNTIKIEEEFGMIEYPIIVETENPEDIIQGIVYEVTTNDLRQADSYEGKHYKRVEVALQSNELRDTLVDGRDLYSSEEGLIS